jgi:maleylpyruvate isomerase
MRPPEVDARPSTALSLDWVRQGQGLLEERIASLDDEMVGQPSRLPRWTRGHVLTHVSRNADALVNLLTWARTGVQTPMYPSTASTQRFMEHATAMQAADWAARVRSAQGRDMAASDVPWMRVREVWIHLVDLDVGVDFDVVPDPIARALVRDVARWMDGRVEHRVLLVGQPTDVVFGGSEAQPPVRVHGSPQALAAWLIGRSRGEGLDVASPDRLPDLPGWL